MLRAKINFSDLDSPVGESGGGIFFGSSVIEPFEHRLLRSVCVESPGLIALVCMERLTGEPAGVELAHVDDDADVTDLVAETQHRLLDWAILLIERQKREIRYSTSLIHSAPVYLRANCNSVEIDWDYSRLLDGSDAEIEWQAALAHIGGLAQYTPETMVCGMYRSVAGTTLRANGAGITAEIPAAFVRKGPQRLKDGAPVKTLFYETVKALLAVRPLTREKTAVEISGGMDSGLIALAAADVLGKGLFSYGAQFDGAMGAAQRARRTLLCDFGGYEDLEVPANRFAPFGERSSRRRRYGVWPQDETYPELFETIFMLLAQAGIDTLLSGLGGDELYAAYVDEEPEEPGVLELSGHPFLTDEGWRRAQLTERGPETRTLQSTSWLSAAGRAQRLLRHGIWPVYPYNCPELATFVGKLPWHYRRDRALLRDILTDKLETPVFRTDYTKESFLGLAIRGLEQNKEYLQAMLVNSPVARRDLVDVDSIRKMLEGDIERASKIELGLAYLVLTTVCFFQE